MHPEVAKLIDEELKLLNLAEQKYYVLEQLSKLPAASKNTQSEYRGNPIDIEREYNEVVDRIEQLRLEVLTRCADYGNMALPRNYNILDRTLKVFPHDVKWAVLEFAVLAKMNTLLVFFLDQDGSIQYDRPDVDLKKIDRLVKQFQNVIESVRKLNTEGANQELADLSKTVYKALIPRTLQEILKDKDIEHLIIVPHGSIHLVPFEALFDGEQYWGLRYALTTNYSLDLARLCVKKRQDGASNIFSEIPSLLLVKNPLLDLKGAEEEVVQTLDTVKPLGIRVNVLEHEKATPAAFIHVANGDSFDILHFAGHALFMGKQPSLSSLYLHAAQGCPGCSGKSKHHIPDFFSADEIVRTVNFKKTPVVYLSACETGIAEVEAGDEMFGMVRALMYSGATSLILSRWLVGDYVAPIFAEEFYRRIFAGEAIAVALKNARRVIFELNPTSFVDWAVFTMQGDPFRVISHNRAG